MTRIKLCGMCRPSDIAAANGLDPEYVGFVFVKSSKRYVSPATVGEFKRMLAPGIKAVGVFADEDEDTVAALLSGGVIDMAQLHGHETDDYIGRLRSLAAGKVIIKAFRLRTEDDAVTAEKSAADYILLDSGSGSGAVFDWKLAAPVHRPYFLAGGLTAENVVDAVRELRPFAVDVSSGIESDGVKDNRKMAAFVAAVRGGDKS